MPPLPLYRTVQPPAADAADQQPLQKSQALARRSAQERVLPVRAVAFEHVQIVQMFVKGNVARVVILNLDQPRGPRHGFHSGADLAVGKNVLDTTIATKGINPCIRRILQHAQNATIRQVSPDQLAVPNTAVGPFREFQPSRCKRWATA